MTAHGKPIALVLLGWLAVAVAPLGAQEPARTAGHKVVVTNSATVYVPADAARLTFMVSTSGMGKTREENEKQAKKLKEVLAGATTQNLDIHVTPLTLSTVISGGAAGGIGFGGAVPGLPGIAGAPGAAPATETQAQTLFTLTIREKDPEKLKALAIKLADTAKENGAKGAGNEDMVMRRGFRMAMGGMNVEAGTGPSIEWLSENTTEARKNAIKKAVREAQENAQAAVGDARLTLMEITVNSHEDQMAAYRAMRNDETSTDAGRIPITVQVTVTYGF